MDVFEFLTRLQTTGRGQFYLSAAKRLRTMTDVRDGKLYMCPITFVANRGTVDEYRQIAVADFGWSREEAHTIMVAADEDDPDVNFPYVRETLLSAVGLI